MSERMSDERLDNLTQSWQEHVGSLVEEYGAPTVHSILSRTESEAMELLDALKAERQRVEELKAEIQTLEEACMTRIRERTDTLTKLEAAEARVEAVRGLVEKWLDDCMNYRCTGKCSNKKCADELEALLNKEQDK